MKKALITGITGQDGSYLAELLLSKRADVSARDNDGSTPLHWAAAMGHRDVVTLLLARGADVNAKDNRSATPLHWAIARDHKDVAETLHQHGGHE